jgi:hypothetical protein
MFMLAQASTGADPVIEELNDLIQLEYDIIAAFQAAIDRLEAVQLRKHFVAFKADHESGTRDLAALVHALGGMPVAANDPALGLTRDNAFFAELADDKDIVRIMRASEEFTVKKYEKTLHKLRAHPEAAPDAAAVLHRNLCNEQLHCKWITAVIGDMS